MCVCDGERERGRERDGRDLTSTQRKNSAPKQIVMSLREKKKRFG